MAVCSPLVAKSGPTGAEHEARSQLDRYVLFLIQSVIIKCEIQCSYKRVITLLNNEYLAVSYITYIHCPLWPCMRAYATANTAHSIPNDNHSDLKRTSSIMISKSYRKFTIFLTGDCSVIFMEDFISNKNLSDEIIVQSPVGNTVNFACKICHHRLYTGCKGCRIIGVSVTNGEHAHSRFTKNVPNWLWDVLDLWRYMWQPSNIKAPRYTLSIKRNLSRLPSDTH